MRDTLRYWFPPGSMKALTVYGFLFGLAVVATFYFHPDITGRNPLSPIVLLGLFGALFIVSRFHPEWTDWSRPNLVPGGDGGSASGGDAGGCGDGGGGGCGGD